MLRMIALPVFVLAVSCSEAPEQRNASSAEPESVAPVAPATGPTNLPTAPPKPGKLATFGDWAVGCDNGGVCTMASLGPEGGDFPDVVAEVAREGGPRGQWLVAFSGRDAQPAGVAIDGRRLAGGKSEFTGREAETIVAAMANGRSLAVLGTGGRAPATVSLAGASATLRYIDDRQGRAGTRTALVAKGGRPSASVPPPRALPVITAVRPGGEAQRPSPAQVAEMRQTAGCDAQGFAGEQATEQHALGGGATLVFVPCSAGAYNLSAALFVLRDGWVAPALADVPTGFAGDSDPKAPAQVVNGSFADGVVTSYSKGRGLGDCGVSQRFAWDGDRLRLIEQAMMEECRGNPDLITTWRAIVARGSIPPG